MTEPAASAEVAVARSPAPALEAVFRAIAGNQMRDMPMVNPVLSVEAVGFRPWHEHWLGILITPWFMNLMLMPRQHDKWRAFAERATRHHVFPAGVFEFIGAREAVLGDYQACSLFSPMFEFAEQAGARATAIAALDALFDPACRERSTLDAAAHKINKRDFLFIRPERVPSAS
jgi:[NiFe] hydrogenase assembly HybE family chaperone